MAAPHDAPDPPPLPPFAVTEIRQSVKALDLIPLDGTKLTLSKDYLTLPRSRSSSDERQCGRRKRGRSLSPFSTENLCSSATLSSASSSESLYSPSSRARSQEHQSHTRSNLHDRRTRKRSRSYNERPHFRRRRRQRRRSKRKRRASEEVTLECKLAKLCQMIPRHSDLSKKKGPRYFQNYDAKFLEIQNSWKATPHQPEKAIFVLQVPTPTSKEPPHLTQPKYGTMSWEYRSFQYNSSLLCDNVIGPQITPLDLAVQLRAKGLITQQVLEEVMHSQGPLLKDKQLLLDALHSQISTNAAHFYEFLEILRKDPALEECCSKLESFPDDIVIPIPDPPTNYAEHLKAVYKRGIFYPKWPNTEMKKFIKLITIEKKKHQSISMHRIFQSDGSHTVSRVLVEGDPGSGKSTFALELCTRWAKGEMLEQFSLVFLFPLRDKRVKKAKSLEDLFSTYFPLEEDQEGIVKAIRYNDGEGVLLILEGFDELPMTAKYKDTREFLVSRLFANIELANATVLITTRPHAGTQLRKYCIRNARTLQIVGFGEEEVKRYIQAAGLSVEQQSSLTEYLDVNPHIREMAYNPLYCAILVQLFQRDGQKASPPKNSTHLFNQLVKDLFLRYMDEKYNKCPAIDLENFPQCLNPPEDEEYRRLCEMAYQGFVNGESEFILPEDFRRLNLMEEAKTPCGPNGTFHFIHPSLQEYLTAFWIHTHYSPEEQFKLMKEHLSNPGHYGNVLQFLAGLSKTMNWEGLAKYAFVDRQKLNVASFYLSSDIPGVQLPFLSWIFENQSNGTCTKVLGEGTIGFYSTYYTTPLDYCALAYCITNSVCKWVIQVQLPTVDWLDTFSKGFHAAKNCKGAIVALEVGHSEISKEGWRFLFSDLINPLQSLRQLIFYDTTPPHTELRNFPDHLPKLRQLQCLALSNTPLGKGGAVSLMKALPQTNITELHLYHTGIGFHDCQALAPYLSDPQCKLRSVDISYNSLTKESVNVFTSALIQNVSLTKLSMSGSKFSHEGFQGLISRLKNTPYRTPLTVLHLQCCVFPQKSISQLCHIIGEDEECVLQSLALGLNPLELSDIQALATMLERNHSIVFLYLKNCSITAAGLSALSSGLHNNTTLCELSLSGNEMTQESINAVCQGFFSEARFACDNIPNMPATPLLCLDSCPEEWKDAVTEIANEPLLLYSYFQEGKAKYRNDEDLPDIKKFISSRKERKHDICNRYIHFSDHNPACGEDILLEEMRPSFVPI